MNANELIIYNQRYNPWFKVGVHDNSSEGAAYLQGLFCYGKSNIERMSEQLSINEQQLHHFISESSWDARGVMGQVAQEMEKTFSGILQPKGLLLDESSWSKKGNKSVGVAKQYLGSEGKIDNGQVVVLQH